MKDKLNLMKKVFEFQLDSISVDLLEPEVTN